MMKYFKLKTSLLIIVLIPLLNYAQSPEQLVWPNTPAAGVFQDFLDAYNSGNKKKMTHFVVKHYKNTTTDYVNLKVDSWLDFYYRFGEVAPYSISINQPNDLEIWLQGKISRAWFAVEFVLDKTSHKVIGTAILQGALPEGVLIGSTDEAEMLNKFKTYLKHNEESGLLKGTVLLQKGNKTVINQGFGLKNSEKNIENTIHTRIDYMSITKMITSVAVLQLVQQGLLDLHSTIDNYLPELPKHIASKITLKMLLSHTSSYELDGINGFREAQQKATSMQQVYALQLKYLPEWEHYANFSPSNQYDYANDSFDLAAIIIEKTTGTVFEDYLKAYIFDIAGMNSTSFEDNDLASRYRYDISVDTLLEVSSYYPFKLSKISGAGGLKGTADDLRLFFDALYHSNLLLDDVHRNIMFSPVVEESEATNVVMHQPFISIHQNKIKAINSYGLGVFISNDGQLNMGHSGVGLGSSSELRYFPNLNYLLIVLANNRNGAPNAYNYFKGILPE